MKIIEKLYTKYHIANENPLLSFYAKVSKDKITLRTYNNNRKFEFTCSDKIKVANMCKLLLELLKK